VSAAAVLLLYFWRYFADMLFFFLAITGLESSGILDDISPKCSPTTFTLADRKKYLRRAKILSYAWRNQRKRDLVTLILHYSLDSSFTN
jgi:hypothetical protein